MLKNENTKWIKVVHVFGREKNIPPELGAHLQAIDQMYPNLKIDFVAVKGTFDCQTFPPIESAKKYMFIGTPGDRFPHNIEVSP